MKNKLYDTRWRMYYDPKQSFIIEGKEYYYNDIIINLFRINKNDKYVNTFETVYDIKMYLGHDISKKFINSPITYKKNIQKNGFLNFLMNIKKNHIYEQNTVSATICLIYLLCTQYNLTKFYKGVLRTLKNKNILYSEFCIDDDGKQDLEVVLFNEKSENDFDYFLNEIYRPYFKEKLEYTINKRVQHYLNNMDKVFYDFISEHPFKKYVVQTKEEYDKIINLKVKDIAYDINNFDEKSKNILLSEIFPTEDWCDLSKIKDEI